MRCDGIVRFACGSQGHKHENATREARSLTPKSCFDAGRSARAAYRSGFTVQGL